MGSTLVFILWWGNFHHWIKKSIKVHLNCISDHNCSICYLHSYHGVPCGCELPCFSLLHLHHAHIVPRNGSHTRITGAGRDELYELLNRIQWTLLYPPLHFLPLKTEHFFSQATDHIASEPLLTSGCLKLYHKIVGPWFFSLLSCCNLKSLLLKEGRGMQ